MSHRAQQIVDAVITALTANSSLGASVYAHRALSLSEPDQELPAVSIRYGGDSPIDEDGASNFAYLDSLLEMQAVSMVRGPDEVSVMQALLDLRRQIHITLMADRSLGLAFVIDTRYGGAAAPELDTATEYIAGRLEQRWLVHYRMNISDPQ